jgi:hypothetical protein
MIFNNLKSHPEKNETIHFIWETDTARRVPTKPFRYFEMFEINDMIEIKPHNFNCLLFFRMGVIHGALVLFVMNCLVLS